MIIFLMIMLGCKVRQQKPSCMVSFCWTKPRTLQAGSTVLLTQLCTEMRYTDGQKYLSLSRLLTADIVWPLGEEGIHAS